MSLWTPYADAPLDLSKVKREQTPETNLAYYQEPPTPLQYYPGYYNYAPPFPNNCYVPSTQMSPVSAESSCSGCENVNVVSPPAPPLSPPASPVQRIPQDVDSLSDDPDFQAFERDALRAMAEKNGGSLLGNNPRMRRAVQSAHAPDDSYRQQRARNNHAAKQSRDRRKLREIHLALKVAYLKNELAKMKTQLGTAVCIRCRHLCNY